MLLSLAPVTTFYVKHRGHILKVLYVYLLFSMFGSSINFNIKRRLMGLLRRQRLFRLKMEKTKGGVEQTTEVVAVSDDKDDGRLQRITGILHYLVTVCDFKTINIMIGQIIIIIAKIYLNLKIIDIDSQLVSSLFSRSYKDFSKLTALWLLIGIPYSYLSSLSTYLANTLSKNLIMNFTKDLLESYLSTVTAKDNLNTFYKINHFANAVEDPHQRISIDVFELSSNLSLIPTMLLNPFLNLAITSQKFFNYDSGAMTEATLFFGLVINISTVFIKLASPNFSRIANSYAQHESAFRQIHSNIITHFEQIALLRSWSREAYDADCYYFILERFLRRNYRKFAFYNFVKTFLIKYTWGAFGLSLCAFPVFRNHFLHVQQQVSKNKVTQDFVQNRSLLMNASNSLGDLLSSKKNLDQIIGTSKRIIEFRNTLDKMEGDYGVINTNSITHNNEMISFCNVPLTTPNNQLLCSPLNFTITHGDNLLILGPNGSGKSSLFRLLSGLWPVTSGNLTIPEYNLIFYLPQRPYLLKGKTNLIEQIIYPKSYHDFEVELAIPGKDSKTIYKSIINILQYLELDYLLYDPTEQSEEGLLTFDSLNNDNDSDSDTENYHSMTTVLHSVKDWSQQLSLGSQQKLAMARLYYHKPKFAVLDECTSQVTPEMENKMYTYATQQLKISVLSVAHRTSIWKFHNYLLQFDGKGDYIFKKFNYKKRLALNEEKLAIEKNLNNLPNLKSRLQELNIVVDNFSKG